MSTEKSIESYLRDARDLSILFPSLKKYARRRKNLSRYEKSAISRAVNIVKIVGRPETGYTPNESRPEHLRNYRYPAFRHRSITSYLESARRMARIIPKMKKFSRRKKLTPEDKISISHYEKRTRHTAELDPVSEKFMSEVDKVARHVTGSRKARVTFPVSGVRAIKLKNIEKPEQYDKKGNLIGTKGVIKVIKRATDYGMNISVKYQNNYSRFYKCVYTGADYAAQVAAAEQLFNEGAIAVYFWINHGRSSAGFRNLKTFKAAIGDDEMREGISEQAIAQIDTDISVKLLQIANARGEYAEGKISKEDLQIIENQMVWIFGVMGLFQQKS